MKNFKYELPDLPEFPYIYEIEPTNNCPYKCIMCPRGLGKMKRKTGFMSMDVFRKLLDMFPSDQKLVRLHHFGEAILHSEIDKMIKMVSDAGLIPFISLNPATLNESLCDRIINAGPGLVCFSIDAFTDQGLKRIRGIKKSYEECMAQVAMFVKKSRSSSHKILKVIQTVALDENYGCTDDGGKNDNSGRNLKFEDLKIKYAASDILFYDADNTGFGDLELAEKTKKGAASVMLENAQPCAAPFSEVSILWNGDVVLCCYDYDGFNVVGNIKHNTIYEIWHNEKIQKIRNIFLNAESDKLKLCSGCFLAPHNFKKARLLKEKARTEEKVLLDLINKNDY